MADKRTVYACPIGANCEIYKQIMAELHRLEPDNPSSSESPRTIEIFFSENDGKYRYVCSPLQYYNNLARDDAKKLILYNHECPVVAMVNHVEGVGR